MSEHIQERQTRLIADFEQLPDWETRYKRLIDWGKKLPPFPPELQLEDLKVKGCQSQVWLKADFQNGRISFRGDSDALLVKGLLALVLYVYSESTPQEILEISPDFIKKLGFASHLSPSRTNGLVSMIKQIKFYATAYSLIS